MQKWTWFCGNETQTNVGLKIFNMTVKCCKVFFFIAIHIELIWDLYRSQNPHTFSDIGFPIRKGRWWESAPGHQLKTGTLFWVKRHSHCNILPIRCECGKTILHAYICQLLNRINADNWCGCRRSRISEYA